MTIRTLSLPMCFTVLLFLRFNLFKWVDGEWLRILIPYGTNGKIRVKNSLCNGPSRDPYVNSDGTAMKTLFDSDTDTNNNHLNRRFLVHEKTDGSQPNCGCFSSRRRCDITWKASKKLGWVILTTVSLLTQLATS